MSPLEYDYLIVGQGLAGTILAHTLITQGFRVMVIDNSHRGSSSQVAAGIINPVTGPRLKNNNEFDFYYSKAAVYYAKLEYHIKQTVFRRIKQIKQIQSDEQHRFLKKRLDDHNYQKLITLKSSKSNLFKPLAYPQLSILSTAVVDTKILLTAGKKWLASLDSYSNHKFDYDQVDYQNQHIKYQQYIAKKIIFCEGYQAIKNPLLKHLPFKLAKGEILTLDMQKNDLDNTMLSWNKWLAPFTNSAKLGSNFEWSDLSLSPSPSVKKDLLENLKTHTKVNAHVINHEVGIRPSTKQREPFIGAISEQPNAYCFNGFGSKGCLLIPFYAECLANHLLHKTPLPSKVTQWL